MSGGATEQTTETQVEQTYVPAHGRGRLTQPWKKGESGNKLGVWNEEYAQVRTLMAQHSLAAAHEQIALMKDDDSRIRFMATEAVLLRGIGKPRDHSGENKTTIDLSVLSEVERALFADLLRKTLGVFSSADTISAAEPAQPADKP